MLRRPSLVVALCDGSGIVATVTRQTGRTWVLVGATGIWLAAAALLGYTFLWLISPPGIGTWDWAILGLSLVVVVGLPAAVRVAIRRAGAAAWALVILGIGVCLVTVPAFLLVATSAATGAWSLVFLCFAACGVAQALGALILIRSKPVESGQNDQGGQ